MNQEIGEKRRAVVFVDGSNLYRRMQEAGIRKGHLDYGLFSNKIIMDRYWVGTYFYTAPVRPQDNEAKYKAQQRFFSKLRQTKNVILKLGVLVPRKVECKHCKKISEVRKEKGVDVHLAVDMIAKAAEDEYDDAYLVSADADFVPAVELVRNTYFKQVFCVAPKGSKYGNLGKACNTAIPIDQDFINDCQAYKL